MKIADETLNHWADRFVAAGLAEVLSLEQFLALSPPMRERRIEQAREIRDAQRLADRSLPPAATVHGDRLIDPLHPGARLFRRPMLYRRRRHA